MQACFINVRHLQTATANEIAREICGLRGDKNTSPFEMLYKKADEEVKKEEEEQGVGKSKETVSSSGNDPTDRPDQAVLNKCFEIFCRSLAGKEGKMYNGYRELTKFEGEQKKIFIAYLFSGSTTRQDANFFAHSFLPFLQMYMEAIIRHIEPFERSAALGVLNALNTFKPIEERKTGFKLNRKDVGPEGTLAAEARKALEKIAATYIQATGPAFRSSAASLGFYTGASEEGAATPSTPPRLVRRLSPRPHPMLFALQLHLSCPPSLLLLLLPPLSPTRPLPIQVP